MSVGQWTVDGPTHAFDVSPLPGLLRVEPDELGPAFFALAHSEARDAPQSIEAVVERQVLSLKLSGPPRIANGELTVSVILPKWLRDLHAEATIELLLIVGEQSFLLNTWQVKEVVNEPAELTAHVPGAPDQVLSQSSVVWLRVRVP
jgi:hypothetical protein